MITAKTIDDVIDILSTIISTELAAQSNLALFPILYKTVTERIKRGIVNQEFDNNERMERLDVIFANRFIDAYSQFKEKEPTTDSWAGTFEAAKDDKLIIMQHILLGINAHINLDLGIAAAQTVENLHELNGFQNDFNRINAILESMVEDVQSKIGKVSPLFYILDKVGKGKEDKVVSFSIKLARDGAWLFAHEYHLSSDTCRTINLRDKVIYLLGTKLIHSKSRLVRWTLTTVRWFESKNLAKIAQVLEV